MTAQVEMTAEKTTTVMTAAPASISFVILAVKYFSVLKYFSEMIGSQSVSVTLTRLTTARLGRGVRRVTSLISLLHYH